MSFVFWVLNLVYFMLPAYFANMAPVFSRYFSFNAPLDFGAKFGSQRLFGEHKTFLGVFFGIFAGLFVAFLQYLIFVRTGFGLVDYSDWLRVGLLLSFGALFGDVVKSFFKRRLRVLPGKSWIPFDQLDFTVGALLFISPVYFLGLKESIAIILVNFLGHLLVNRVGFFLGIRKEKF